jgi:MFS family permease
MTAISTANGDRGVLDILDRERIIAKPGFNRWLVPPAALAIHLCIGMAYGFSVFWLPLSRAIGLQKSVACAPDAGLLSALVVTSCDWKISELGWMYTLFFVFLGSAAAIWGGWLERSGPRKAGVVAALCWCGASPMLQEIFGGSLIGHPEIKFTALDPDQRRLIAAIAAGFTGLLSLFNIGGRFFWASLSDYMGRKATYYTFFALGIALYAAAPWAAHIGSKTLFVVFFCVILSMYGGGFATVPAYLADVFGTQFVGAIHGRLLTAWSTAGIVGPVVVNYIREAQIAAGVPRESVYDFTMYILAGMLVAGFICNFLVRPLGARWFMKPAEVTALQAKSQQSTEAAGSMGIGQWQLNATSVLAWLAVGIPIASGAWITLANALVLSR